MWKTFNKLLKCNYLLGNVQKRHKNKEVTVSINGKDTTVPAYLTVLQALRYAGVVFPHFCFHERLSIAGNCRMCLVQIVGMFKPQIACAIHVSNGMKIQTNSEMTLKAQESVLEFILADHPLDCPICDQGGECDLQDLTMRFGNDRSRYTDIHFEGKRAVEDKDMGPYIRTCMNRCIHCTRCIRFASQIAGIEMLGSTGRGHDMLVGTYVDKMFLSELSGNIIDLCPVGSLTSIPYMFKARPWEVRRTDSVDVTDATGTNIQLNYRFNKLVRVLPRENDEVNQEWVSDKGRWAVDSLEMQRLVTPMMVFDTSGLCPVEWDVALRTAGCLIEHNGKSIAAVAGPHVNIETLVACKDLLNKLGSEDVYIERNITYTHSGTDLRFAYSLNIPMKEIPKADKILLIGTHPRFEAPILNVWIRQAFRTNECDIFVIGPQCEFNYHVCYLGEDSSAIDKACTILAHANRPLVFIGVGLLDTRAGIHVMDVLTKITAQRRYEVTWPIINFVAREASYCGALEVGWKPGAVDFLSGNKPKMLIALGCDQLFASWQPGGTKVIYIGYQGDQGSQHATLVLPGAAYTEAGGSYMSMENRTQLALPAVTPPGKARSDWKIIRALAEYAGIDLPYSDAKGLSDRMVEVSPAAASLDTFQYNLGGDLLPCLVKESDGSSEGIDVDIKCLRDYYCSDIFSCNSPNMIKGYKAACEYEKKAYAKN